MTNEHSYNIQVRMSDLLYIHGLLVILCIYGEYELPKLSIHKLINSLCANDG